MQYAIKNDYTIVNTMSGGFDSRTILGGIEKYIENKNYTNITCYKTWLQKIKEKLHSCTKILALAFKQNLDGFGLYFWIY